MCVLPTQDSRCAHARGPGSGPTRPPSGLASGWLTTRSSPTGHPSSPAVLGHPNGSVVGAKPSTRSGARRSEEHRGGAQNRQLFMQGGLAESLLAHWGVVKIFAHRWRREVWERCPRPPPALPKPPKGTPASAEGRLHWPLPADGVGVSWDTQGVRCCAGCLRHNGEQLSVSPRRPR